MSEIAIIRQDFAKSVFEVHGNDAQGHAVLRKRLRRSQLLDLFGRLEPCVVEMEACVGAHYWEREIG